VSPFKELKLNFRLQEAAVIEEVISIYFFETFWVYFRSSLTSSFEYSKLHAYLSSWLNLNYLTTFIPDKKRPYVKTSFPNALAIWVA